MTAPTAFERMWARYQQLRHDRDRTTPMLVGITTATDIVDAQNEQWHREDSLGHYGHIRPLRDSLPPPFIGMKGTLFNHPFEVVADDLEDSTPAPAGGAGTEGKQESND